MGKSRFIELMAKSIGKSASKEELEELNLFLEQFPEYKKMQQVTHSIKAEVKQPARLGKEKDLNSGLAELWDRIKNSEDTELIVRRRNTPVFWKWASAAAVILVMLTAALFYTRPSSLFDHYFTADKLHRLVVPYGETKEVVLADGTRVKLNAGSTLIYPETFAKMNREVTLIGEGFFEVTKNPKRPFLVRTRDLTIKVLGTIFNVKAYPNEKKIETTLLRGKVQVELKAKPEKKIILMPNEKLIVSGVVPSAENKAAENKSSARLDYQIKKLAGTEISQSSETAWLSNRIVFTNENFEEVAKQIERKYNVQIVFEDPALKTEQLSGALDKETLENALSIMKMTTPFKFRTEGRMIYIAHK